MMIMSLLLLNPVLLAHPAPHPHTIITTSYKSLSFALSKHSNGYCFFM